MTAEPEQLAEERLLDDPENHEYTRRFLRLSKYQKAGWAVMTLLVLAGLAGLFGAGPLANQQIARGALALDYDRFGRLSRFDEFTASISEGGPIELWLDRAFVDAIDIQRVTPEPESMSVSADRVTFGFELEPPASISFVIRPSRFGWLSGRIGVGDDELAFSQLVFP